MTAVALDAGHVPATAHEAVAHHEEHDRPGMNRMGLLLFMASEAMLFLAQAAARNLTVVYGWDYFIHGWSQVVAEVFELELTPERFQAMSKAAYEVR